jgi:hypothetical protein
MRPRDLDHPYSQNVDGDGCEVCSAYPARRHNGEYLCEECLTEVQEAEKIDAQLEESACGWELQIQNRRKQ